MPKKKTKIKPSEMPWQGGDWDAALLGQTRVDREGTRYQTYADPASPTGYTAKRSDANGDSFEYVNPPTDVAGDERRVADTRTAELASQNKYRDTLFGEDARRFNVGAEQTASTQRDRVNAAKRALKEQRRQYDLTFGEGRREYDQSFGQRQFEFNANNALAQRGAEREDRTLGLDVLKTGASMRGPLNFLEGDAFSQGANGAGLSPYVAALQSGRPVAYGGGTATQGNPTPLTVGTLANAITGGESGAAAGTDQYGRARLSPQNQSFVDAASKVYQQGLANQPQGFLENMSPDQRKAFFDAGGWLGRNTDSEEEYYKRSRPGQGSYV